MTDDATPPYGTPQYGTQPYEPRPPYDPDAPARPLPGYDGTPYPGTPSQPHHYGEPPPPPPAERSGRPRWILPVAGILAAVAAGVGLFLTLYKPAAKVAAPAPPVVASAAPAPAAPPPAAPAAAPAALTVTATADCTAPDSVDGSGTSVSYAAANMVDGRPDTAWRCDGNGAGRKVKINLGGTATVSQIGIVPGYAKTDPVDKTDRYAQNRRIAKVRYVFDDGTAVEQALDTAAGNRALQTVPVAGVTTTSITMEVLASVPGTRAGKQAASDRVAISELQVVGVAR